MPVILPTETQPEYDVLIGAHGAHESVANTPDSPPGMPPPEVLEQPDWGVEQWP